MSEPYDPNWQEVTKKVFTLGDKRISAEVIIDRCGWRIILTSEQISMMRISYNKHKTLLKTPKGKPFKFISAPETKKHEFYFEGDTDEPAMSCPLYNTRPAQGYYSRRQAMHDLTMKDLVKQGKRLPDTKLNH